MQSSTFSYFGSVKILCYLLLLSYVIVCTYGVMQCVRWISWVLPTQLLAICTFWEAQYIKLLFLVFCLCHTWNSHITLWPSKLGATDTYVLCWGHSVSKATLAALKHNGYRNHNINAFFSTLFIGGFKRVRQSNLRKKEFYFNFQWRRQFIMFWDTWQQKLWELLLLWPQSRSKESQMLYTICFLYFYSVHDLAHWIIQSYLN